MKLSLGPNHNFLCQSSWDFIERNTKFAVQIFVKTSLLILIARTALKNELLDNLLQPQMSQALLERERTSKQIYSSTFERCRKQTTQSHAYRNGFELGHHLEIGQKVLYKIHIQDLTRSQKLQQRQLGPFTVTKPITKSTYQIQDDKNPTIIKTVQRKPPCRILS